MLRASPLASRRPNGTWYHGRWENDTRKGQGKLVWRGGGYYVGEWHDGHQEGPGTLLTRYASAPRNQSWTHLKPLHPPITNHRNGFLFEGTWKKCVLAHTLHGAAAGAAGGPLVLS
jgi:hypothetical protein